MTINFKKIHTTVKKACLQSGNVLKDYFRKDIEIIKKSDINLLTKADLESEKKIISHLKDDFSDIPIIGEETHHKEFEEYCFLIDPLDGTTNFANKIPFYAISIALYKHPEVVYGAVYLPEKSELYYSFKNQGAFKESPKDKIKLSVSKKKFLKDSIIATGFPYDIWDNYRDVLSSLKAIVTSSRAIRRFGAASIDLAYVAEGIFDGYFELRLKPWDTAAGCLLVSESSGRVTDFKGNDYNPYLNGILASNKYIHEEMVKKLSKSI